jgi:hypothetical protein
MIKTGANKILPIVELAKAVRASVARFAPRITVGASPHLKDGDRPNSKMASAYPDGG